MREQLGEEVIEVLAVVDRELEGCDADRVVWVGPLGVKLHDTLCGAVPVVEGVSDFGDGVSCRVWVSDWVPERLVEGLLVGPVLVGV